MKLRLRYRREVFDPLGGWPLSPRPTFMEGDAYRSLLRDLERYVLEEIPGRSYLISGHRGSGKTSLTVQAIEDLRRLLLEKSTYDIPVGTACARPQRPLLVKLHGPSLADPAIFEAPKPKAKAPNAPRTGLIGPPVAAAAAAAPSEAKVEPSPVDPEHKAAHAALVQITIGLYRALAAEAALGYAAHARESGPGVRQDAQESAAQLTFDLDGGPEPAQLRAAWARLGRVPYGVFWPSRADETLKQSGMHDEAFREIVALGAAAQAYQVCIGAVTYEYTQKSTDSQSLELQGKGVWDMKDAVGRVGALGVGALTGAALWTDQPATAVAAGALVWLAGTGAVTWTRTRKTGRDRTADYTFMRDRSIQTLDRELPTVIQRVRDAGLAPVFVIDELDKLVTPIDTIEELIKRLKHIVADYGFFCFLTDRSYFDYVQQAVQDRAFPREHTYFSERWLVAYRPAELFEHIYSLIVTDSEGPTSNDSADPEDPDSLARSTLTYWILHRAKLNFVDVGRELNRLVGKDGYLTVQAADLPGRRDIRVAAAVQLAVEQVLQTPAISTRLGADSAFAQMAFDALYAISRCWEADQDSFDTSPTNLREHLEKRLNADRPKPDLEDKGADKVEAPAESDLPRKVEDADLELLGRATVQLAELLADFGALARAVQERTGPSSRIAEIIPLDLNQSLLVRHSRQSPKYRFAFDVFGQPRGVTAAPSDDEVGDLLRLVAALEAFLKAYAIEFRDLTRSGLLPAALDWAAIVDARLRLGPDKAVGGASGRRSAISVLRSLRQTLDDLGPRLSAGLALCEHLVADGAGQATYQTALEALARYPVLGAALPDPAWTAKAWAESHPGFPSLETSVTISGLAETLADFADQGLRGTVRDATVRGRLPMETIVGLWRPRFLRWFDGVTNDPQGFGYQDLLDAATGTGPGAFLRLDLGRMTLAEWSEFCLWALPEGRGPTPPRWTLVAALRALGFPRTLLETVAEAAGPDGRALPDAEKEEARQFVRQTRKGVPGPLVIRLDEGLDTPRRNLSRSASLLYVSRSDFYDFELGLSWLRDHGAFTGILDEVEYDRQEGAADAS